MYLKLGGISNAIWIKTLLETHFFFSTKFLGTNKVKKRNRKRIKEEDDLSYSGGIEESG